MLSKPRNEFRRWQLVVIDSSALYPFRNKQIPSDKLVSITTRFRPAVCGTERGVLQQCNIDRG